MRFGKSSGLRILSRNTHCKSIRRCYGFLSDYLSFVSHRLHKEHRARIVSLACTSGMLHSVRPTVASVAMQSSVCSVQSVWKSNICVMIFWRVALFFYSSWVGWCHRLYCLRVSEWFAKCFLLHSYNQLFMSNLFAKVLPFICYCCCKDNTEEISTSDLGNRDFWWTL